jgi:hypothetical protein
MSLILGSIVVCLIGAVAFYRCKAARKMKSNCKDQSRENQIAGALINLKEKLSRKCSKSSTSKANDQTTISNIAEGTHCGRYTDILAEDMHWDNRLVKCATDGSGICINHSDNLPIGVVNRASLAKEHVSVQLLGCCNNTILMTAHSGIRKGEFVYTAINGTIQGHPTIPGSYYRVGIALTSADSAGSFVEVDPCMPIELSIK